MNNVTLGLLMRFAYGLSDARQLIGVPAWATEESFDIEGRIDGSDLKSFNDLPKDQRTQRLLQAILAERFKLVTHREVRSQSGYVLVVAKKGTKLQPHTGDRGATYLSTSTGHISLHGLPMASLANALTRQAEKPVQDRTGLTGDFDLELHWTPDMDATPHAVGMSTGESTTDSQEPNLFAALQEQLGLRLESAKVPVECVVVDHVEKPEEN